ncbi:hypothetical protein [Flavobacterium rhizosphaerae]|uniref:Tetratricopeptide repeat protein n=1 Tax=Flavobacterium rhizosphaerae TaxID=3163298 RepID=A0ABW8YVG2_9FLAO
MIRLFIMLVVLVTSTAGAQTQYETGMQKAFGLWQEGKPAEASALFERIAAAEKDNWLPYYYTALVNTTEAFTTKDKETVKALLTKAQAAQDTAMYLSMDNAELLVMQALIHTAWITYDPMTNGMKLSAKVNELYAKASKIAPENPRVVLNKAEFEMGSAKYFGTDTAPICKQLERAVTLFANFKAETPFHPNWGKERAEAMLQECNK